MKTTRILFAGFGGQGILFSGGLEFAASWWVSGIPFDLMHCAGNFAMALLLFKPLRSLLEKQFAKF